MSKVLKSSNKFLMSGGRWLTREGYVPPPPPPPTRYVYLNQSTGGTISASPMSGVDGETVTLSNTPDTNYTFDGYSVNGATLYSGNKFDFDGSDVTCSASWTYVQPSLPAYTIRMRFMDGWNPTTGKGTWVQVSSSPNIWDLTYENTDWSRLIFVDNYLLEVIDANSTGVSNMSNMFYGCQRLTSVPLFDTSSVTDMSYMFYDCMVLTSVPLFDTSSVTDMSDMFDGCHNLTSVPLFDTSSVTNMCRMFHDCWDLTSVPLFDTSSVTTMLSMFDACQRLTSVPLFDTSSVTTMLSMFYGCQRLTSVPLFDTSSVTRMDQMFRSCRSLTAVPLLDTSSVTNMSSMFSGCYNVESGALALYQQASTQSIVPSHSGTFSYCGSDTVTGAAELAQIPSSWK